MIRVKLKNISSQFQLLSNKIKLPDRLKGGRIEKWADYWNNVVVDYKMALGDIVQDCRNRPFKASVYVSGIGVVLHACASNPDLVDFRDALQSHLNDSGMLSSNIRNREVDDHFNYLADCLNHGLVRRVSFGFGSFLWMDNYSQDCGLFKAQCTYLKPRYATFHNRIVDVGFFGRWWVAEGKFKHFDINDEEWTPKEPEITSASSLQSDS